MHAEDENGSSRRSGGSESLRRISTNDLKVDVSVEKSFDASSKAGRKSAFKTFAGMRQPNT